MLKRTSLPLPDPEFEGKIGFSAAESSQDFPKPIAVPNGAPNVILILLDDVGFGHPSTFGGPVEMSALDRLAKRGLKYNRMHTTAMCTPTRAALLTGRNHHNVATGAITNLATGFPGYNAIWPRSCSCIAEILRANGYATAAFGKWHNTPEYETSPAGPFDRWPTGLGFEYFFGFHGADANQWNPTLVENTRTFVRDDQDALIHLDEDMANRAIDWIRMQKAVNPQRPFFLYYAPGTAHSPHHAPKSWMEKYRNKFSYGWDVQRQRTFEKQRELGVIPPDAELTPRPAEIPAWDETLDKEKRLGCRLMEAFAGALSHCDYQISRILDELDTQQISDDTLVVYIAGDNGPSAEGTLQGQVNKWGNLNGMPQSVAEQLKLYDEIGGPLTYNNCPVGWGWSGSSPMQWVKQIASHFGGTRNGAVISWPRRIKDHGALRQQFHHCIDVVPTILEAAKIPAPEAVDGITQREIEGVSMIYTFDEVEARSRRKTQYFEMLGNRAIYHDGWVAGARHRGRLPWQIAGGIASGDFNADPWELYHVDEDFSQAKNLAAKFPDKLRELQALWLEEAKRCNVLPLDDRYGERYHQGPSPARYRKNFTYTAGLYGIPEGSAPNLKGRSHRIVAEVSTSDEQASGMIVTAGGRFGGYAFYIRDRSLYYVHNVCGLERHTVAAANVIKPGACKLGMTFVTDKNKLGAGGKVTLEVDGKEVATGYVPRTVPLLYSYTETFDIGLDTGTPVDETYACPFRFKGEIRRVAIDILDDLATEDKRAEQQAVRKAIEDHE